MMSNYLQNAISPELKKKYPNLLRTIGVNTDISKASEEGELFTLFKNFPLNNKEVNVDFRIPLLQIAGVEDLSFDFITNIQITASTNLSNEPIPVIEDSVFGSNSITQYSSLSPINVSFSGIFTEHKIQIKGISDVIGEITQPINALANTMGADGVSKTINVINDTTNTIESVKSQINDIINKGGAIYKQATKIIDNIKNNSFSKLLDGEDFGEKIPLFIWSCLLLRTSRIPIDLNIYNIRFPNFLLNNLDLTLTPDGEKLQVKYQLDFQYVVKIGGEETPKTMTNSLTKKKRIGNVSSI